MTWMTSDNHLTRRSDCAKWTLLAGAFSLLSGCASTGGQHVTGWGEVTVAPGVTGTCQSNPCHVYFQMPAGTGTYEVTGNEVRIGNYPAGQKVSLGSLFESNAIKVPGAGVSPAYVYVPASF